ncbi:hypothetical protein B0H14DRAFT_3512444 [Mycena olivaceomarginata]|nr:hypothetical protein B0H14DRAFT_3512444 [Mycena olivaceomarginata]
MSSPLLASIGACTIVVSAFIWLRHSSASHILGTLPGPRSPSWAYGTSALVAWSAGKPITPLANFPDLCIKDSWEIQLHPQGRRSLGALRWSAQALFKKDEQLFLPIIDPSSPIIIPQ